MLIPQGFGILKATFPPDDLGKAFGAFGPTIGLAVVGAPILGGALIAWDVAGLGWRTIFLINVPLGLAALALAVGGAAGVARRGRPAPRPGRDGAGVDRPRAAGVPAGGGPRAGLARVGVRHAGRGGRAARRVRRAPGAAQPGGPGAAGRARAVPAADVHRGDGGGAGAVRGYDRARAGAGPLPPARAGLHAAAGRAHAGAVGVGDRRGVGAVGRGAGRPPRPHGAADRRGRGGGGARRRAADRRHGGPR